MVREGRGGGGNVGSGAGYPAVLLAVTEGTGSGRTWSTLWESKPLGILPGCCPST